MNHSDPTRISDDQHNNAPAVPQGEPDFWGSGDGCWVRATDKLVRPDASRFNIPLYAAPSQPVTLTDSDIDVATRHLYHGGKPTSKEYRVGIVRAALRAKGGKL